MKIILLVLTLLFYSTFSAAYVTCEAKVNEILPHKNGTVWIELADGTKIMGAPEDPGLDRNVSIALAALMADKKVRILLFDGQLCGINNHNNWAYVVAFKQNN